MPIGEQKQVVPAPSNPRPAIGSVKNHCTSAVGLFFGMVTWIITEALCVPVPIFEQGDAVMRSQPFMLVEAAFDPFAMMTPTWPAGPASR